MNSSCTPVFQAAGGSLGGSAADGGGEPAEEGGGEPAEDGGGEPVEVLAVDRRGSGGTSVAVPPDTSAEDGFFDRLDTIGGKASDERGRMVRYGLIRQLYTLSSSAPMATSAQ